MNESDARSQGAQLWKHLYRTAILETNRELVPRLVLEVYANPVLEELKRRCQSAKQSRTEHSIEESQVWISQEQAF